MQIVGSNLCNAFSNSLPILHDRQAALIYTHNAQCAACEQQGNKPAYNTVSLLDRVNGLIVKEQEFIA